MYRYTIYYYQNNILIGQVDLEGDILTTEYNNAALEFSTMAVVPVFDHFLISIKPKQLN